MKRHKWFGRLYSASIIAWIVGFFGNVLFGLPLWIAAPMIIPAYGFLVWDRWGK